MATLNAEVVTPPVPTEASTVVRPAEVTNAAVASKPSVSVGQSIGPVRRSVG